MIRLYKSAALPDIDPAGFDIPLSEEKRAMQDTVQGFARAAFQLFGGNSTMSEFPIEKLFRDIRSSMIDDRRW